MAEQQTGRVKMREGDGWIIAGDDDREYYTGPHNALAVGTLVRFVPRSARDYSDRADGTAEHVTVVHHPLGRA